MSTTEPAHPSPNPHLITYLKHGRHKLAQRFHTPPPCFEEAFKPSQVSSHGRSSEHNIGIEFTFIVGYTFPTGDGVVDGVEAQERDFDACDETAGRGVTVIVIGSLITENDARDRRIKLADCARSGDLSRVDPGVIK